MRAVDLTKTLPEPSAIDLVEGREARRHTAVPVARIRDATGQDVLVVAVADPSNTTAADGIRAECGLKVVLVLAAAEQVDDALRTHYGESPIESYGAE